MKIIALIFALMVLVQSAVPCADYDSISSKNQTELAKSNESSDSHEDTCSPFCICTCCAGFSIYCITNSVEPIVVITGYKYNHLNDRSTLSIALPIWQPPRIS